MQGGWRLVDLLRRRRHDGWRLLDLSWLQQVLRRRRHDGWRLRSAAELEVTGLNAGLGLALLADGLELAWLAAAELKLVRLAGELGLARRAELTA